MTGDSWTWSSLPHINYVIKLFFHHVAHAPQHRPVSGQTCCKSSEVSVEKLDCCITYILYYYTYWFHLICVLQSPGTATFYTPGTWKRLCVERLGHQSQPTLRRMSRGSTWESVWRCWTFNRKKMHINIFIQTLFKKQKKTVFLTNIKMVGGWFVA